MKNINLKDYAATIRKAIAECRKEDANYSWAIKAINMNSVKFQWSYLSDKDEPFVLRVDDGYPAYVTVKVPYGGDVDVMVGNTRWDDAKTMDEGIYMAIKAAANYAKHTF